MSNKNKIAVIIFIAAASLALWLYLQNSRGTIRRELHNFAVSDTASITKIYMVNTAGAQVTLERQKPAQWQVNGKFIARNDAVRNLLVCIRELQVRSPVSKSAVENISKQLATGATKIEIYKDEELMKTYYVGGDTQDGLGTYMLLADPETGKNSTMPFVMFIPGFNGFLSVRYFVEEDLWRDRSVYAFYPDQISSITVEYAHLRDSSFSISLSNNNTISLYDSKGNAIADFDTLKAKQYITYYSNIQYESLQNDMRPSIKDSVLAKGPVHIITLKDRQGKAHRVKTFSKPPDPNSVDPITGKPDTEDFERMFALVNDDKDIAAVQYYVFGKLFQSVSYFKKKDSFKTVSANK